MTKSPTFDAVICVGVKDVLLVKKTVRYVNRNIRPDGIYLILNKKFFGFYSRQFLESEHVSLIDEATLVPGMNIQSVRSMVDAHFTHGMRAGWYFQQFLKMGFALSPYAKSHYLIWDADTIPTSPLHFFDEQGKMLLTKKTEYHRPYFDTMQRLIGMDKSVDFSFIAEHMIIKTAFMQSLINTISQSGGVKRGMPLSSMLSHPTRGLASLSLRPMAPMSPTSILTASPSAHSTPLGTQDVCSAAA